MTTILIKKRDTAGAPTAGDLTNAAGGVEIAVNTSTKRVYSKDSGGNIIELGTNPTSITTGAVSATQVNITGQGDLRLEDTTGGEYVALQAPTSLASSYTLTLPVDDGTNGQALITDGAGNLSWSTAASGDVYGPASATDNAVARFDLTTGKLIQNSVVTIGDTGDVAGVGALSMSGAVTLSGGTANGVAYLNGSKVLTTGSALTFDGTNLGVGTASPGSYIGKLVTFGGVISTVADDASGGFQGFRSSNDSGSSNWYFNKSRGTTASKTAVIADDSLGILNWRGYDGANNIVAAAINVQVDGTSGTNDMPGRLVFSTTADGASSPTERYRISQNGESRWSVGGSEQMRLTSTGLGIGTSSPTDGQGFGKALDISSASYGAALYIRSSASASTYGWFGYDYTALASTIAAYGTNTKLQFNAGTGAVKMTLDSSGKVLIGATSSAGGYSGYNFLIGGAASPMIKMQSTTGPTIWDLYVNGSTDFRFAVGSSDKAKIDASTGAYTALSDANKKKDFEDSTAGLAEVLKLKPMLYRMVDQDESVDKQLGFIAQDVKDVIPQAYVESEGINGAFIGLQDRPFIAVMVKAIQELKAELDATKAEVAALKAVN